MLIVYKFTFFIQYLQATTTNANILKYLFILGNFILVRIPCGQLSHMLMLNSIEINCELQCQRHQIQAYFCEMCAQVLLTDMNERYGENEPFFSILLFSVYHAQFHVV